MNYDVVFDAANNTHTIWDSIRWGILFITFGIALNVSSALQSLFTKCASPKFSKLFSKIVLGFAIIYTVMSFGSYTDSERAKSASQNNSCIIVTGLIKNFQTYDAGESEKFSVQGVTFAYSDYERTGGFNTTMLKDGPISEGLNARICYIRPKRKRNNIIVRLELEK